MTVLVFIAVMSTIVWLIAQFRETRRPVWVQRRQAFAARVGPLVKHVKDDAHAVRMDVRAWRVRRRGW
jgi:membrane protein implicated in regulation of membrane protease activity